MRLTGSKAAATISVPRIVETDVMNIGSVAVRQIRELVADLLET